MSQVGRYPEAGFGGLGVQGERASPPVGADPVALKDGDEVLWYYATFSDTGGPPTLSLKPPATNCYTVTSFNDAGKSTAAAGALVKVDGVGSRPARTERLASESIGPVRAYAVGAVRSNAVK